MRGYCHRRQTPQTGGWDVYINGGRIDVGLDAVQWAVEAEKHAAREILMTSMDCDGVKNGYDLELTRAVSERGHSVIASGGAGTMSHLPTPSARAGPTRCSPPPFPLGKSPFSSAIYGTRAFPCGDPLK